MEKFKNFYKKYINTDGVLHFLVSFSITVSIGLFLNVGLAYFIAVFIGFTKEIIWDSALKKGTFQWKDIIFDLLGGGIGFGLLILSQLIK
jgi:hypothetical protein